MAGQGGLSTSPRRGCAHRCSAASVRVGRLRGGKISCCALAPVLLRPPVVTHSWTVSYLVSSAGRGQGPFRALPGLRNGPAPVTSISRRLPKDVHFWFEVALEISPALLPWSWLSRRGGLGLGLSCRHTSALWDEGCSPSSS